MADARNPYEAPTSNLSGPVGYRPATTLTTVVVILLFASAGTEVLGAIADMVAPMVDPTYHDPEALSGVALGVAGLGLLVLFTYLASAVLFLVWIHRACANARALGALGMQFTPGWCVGWWFIPFANLFKPYQAVREIYQASDPNEEDDSWAASVVPSTIGAWWATWIIGNILGQIQVRSWDADPTFYAGLSLVASVISVISALLAAKIVRDILSRQEARARRGSGAEPQAVGPQPPLLAGS